MKEIDLVAALGRHYQSKITPRGDEAYAHISDMAGPCDRATWMRRSGFTALPWEPKMCAKMVAGKEFEANVIAMLTEAYPGWIHEDVQIGWFPETGALNLGVTEAEPPDPFLIGHLDALEIQVDGSPQHVYEAKSTSFLRGKEPDAPQPHYLEQIIGYCAAVRCDGTLIIGCRESGKVVVFDVKCGEFERAWAKDRALEVLRVTDPAAPMPPAEPRTPWACKSAGSRNARRTRRFRRYSYERRDV